MASNPYCRHGLLPRAIALSLLLHAVLLLQPAPGSRSAESVGTLNAVLNPLMATRQTNPELPAQAHHASAGPRNVAPAAEAKASPAAAAASQFAEANDTVQMRRAETTRAVAASAVSGMDFGEARKAYVFAIAAAAGRVKEYPPRAFAAGQTGTAEIRVSVAAGGAAQAPQLQKSSGYADIDDAALSFVAAALRRTPIPPALRGDDFDVVLPISFTIEKP